MTLRGKYVRTLEILKKQSLAQKGRVSDFKGKKHTNETKEKISLKLTGRKESDITREKKRRMRLGKKHSIETRRKMSESSKKEGSRERQRASFNLRKTLEYRLWREAIFKRDDFTCVWCFKRGGKIQADHIKPFSLYPALRFALDNGRTLCVSCHKKTDTFGIKMKWNKQKIS